MQKRSKLNKWITAGILNSLQHIDNSYKQCWFIGICNRCLKQNAIYIYILPGPLCNFAFSFEYTNSKTIAKAMKHWIPSQTQVLTISSLHYSRLWADIIGRNFCLGTFLGVFNRCSNLRPSDTLSSWWLDWCLNVRTGKHLCGKSFDLSFSKRHCCCFNLCIFVLDKKNTLWSCDTIRQTILGALGASSRKKLLQNLCDTER